MIQQRCIQAYREHRNLKVAAREVGIPWQTVYVHLRRAGEPVVGDKLKYGSDTDKLAARAEQEFLKLVPFAEDQNTRKFQSKVDFRIGDYGVDVKASRLQRGGKRAGTGRWAYSIKKQEATADFFVCFGLDERGDKVLSILLVPGEIARYMTTISASLSGGKWADYSVEASDLRPFFEELLRVGEKHTYHY